MRSPRIWLQLPCRKVLLSWGLRLFGCVVVIVAVVVVVFVVVERCSWIGSLSVKIGFGVEFEFGIK